MSWANRYGAQNYGSAQDTGHMRQRELDRNRSMNDRMSGMGQSNMGGRGMNRMMNQDNGNRGYGGQSDRYKDSGDYGNFRGGNRNQQSMPDEFETGIPLHLDKFSGSFDVMTKVCGSQRENLEYIEKTTGAKIALVGRGTGKDPVTGVLSTEPAQIIIRHPEMKGLELTEQLVESLLKSVQEDYQEHLESEYKNMENMLGLEGDAMGGGSSNMGGMSNNPAFMGQGRMNDQMRYCNYCDINCGDDTLYAIHCKGVLHRQKLQEYHSRQEANDRVQNQMGRSSSMREPMSMTTKRELDQAFTQLLYRQLQPGFVSDLRDRCEYLAQSKPKPNLLPRNNRNRHGFCSVCSKSVGRDMQNHMWTRDHREMYLMLQLNLGLKKFSQEYGDAAVPDMDTNGGRRLATTSLDDYFIGNESLPVDVDPDLYKEVVILLGFAYKFECKVCNVSLRNEAKWVQHVMSLGHCYKCITTMMDMGVAAYTSQNGDVPSINKGNIQETIKKYFDVDGEDRGFGGNWHGPKDSETVGLGMGEEWSGGGDDASGANMFPNANFNNQGGMRSNFGRDQPESYETSFMGGNRLRDRSRSPVGRDSGFMSRDPQNLQHEDGGNRNGRRNRRSRWNDEDDRPRGGGSMSGGRGQPSSVPSLLTANIAPPTMVSSVSVDNEMMGLGMPNRNMQRMASGGNMAGTGMRGQAANVVGVSGSGVTPNPGRGLLGDGAKAMAELGIAGNLGGQALVAGQSQVGAMNPRMQMMQNQMAPQQFNQPQMASQMNQVNQMNQMGQMSQMSQMGQMNPMSQMNPMDQMSQMNAIDQMSQMNQMGQMSQMRSSAQPLMSPMMQPNTIQSLRAQGAAAIQAVMGSSQEGLSMTDRTLVAEVQRLTGIKDSSLVIQALEVLSSLGPGVSQALGSINSINLLIAQLSAVVRPNQKALIQPLVQALNSGSINPQAVIGFKGKGSSNGNKKKRPRKR